jgi:hypothetical protein
MKKSSIAMICALVIGGSVAPIGRAAPAPTVGTYEGTDESGPALMHIRGVPPQYKVDIQTGTTGCGGGVAGAATVDPKGRLVLSAPDGEMSCRVIMTPKAGGWSLQEGEGCGAYHGDMCGFTGAVKRVGK